ncbi:MAG: type III secretion system export apparatus subunit SctU [Chlamydiota bacterium]
MAEKSEKATPKKLRDARKKGQVAKSQDAPSAATFIVSLAATLISIRYIYDKLSGFLFLAFSKIDTQNIAGTVAALFDNAITVIFTSVVPIFIVTAFTGVIINFLLIGPVFAPEAFKPDIKKFNPITNLKNKFKLKTLVELIKQLAKIIGAIIIIYTVVKKSIPDLIATVNLPILEVLSVYSSFLLEVIIKVGIFFIVVGAADLVYQRRNFSKEMMMEKHEVKQEYKNTEGDPQIKSKRKQIGQELAYSDSPQAPARHAKAIVTNPVHIAVAVSYEPEKYSLPYICTMGQNHEAALIVKEAEKYDVPVLRNVDLAHRLYDEGEVWDFIPESTYEAVAEVLRWLASLEQE